MTETSQDKFVKITNSSDKLIYQNWNQVAWAKIQLGLALKNCGDLNASVQIIIQAKKLFWELGLMCDAQSCFLVLGEIYLEQGKKANAVEMFSEVLALCSLGGQDTYATDARNLLSSLGF